MFLPRHCDMQLMAEGEKNETQYFLVCGLTNQSDRCAVLQRWNGRPLPCAFLTCTVTDLGQQMCVIRVPVFEDVSRDLDEEGVQLCLVPAVESLHFTIYSDELYCLSPFDCAGTAPKKTKQIKTTSFSSPAPSHRDSFPERPSSGDRPHKSAACHHTQCHCGPFSQNALRPRLQPAEEGETVRREMTW